MPVPRLPLTGCALVVFALAFAACTGARSLSDLPALELTGHYTEGPDGQWFRPCAADAGDPAWWVTFTDQAVAQRAAPPVSDLLGEGQSVFVRWIAAQGDQEAGAPAGPGPGTRYVLVREILNVRASATDDCAAP